MISVRDLDSLPPMTEERWAEFFGVPLERIAPEIVKFDVVRRFFDVVAELEGYE